MLLTKTEGGGVFCEKFDQRESERSLGAGPETAHLGQVRRLLQELGRHVWTHVQQVTCGREPRGTVRLPALQEKHCACTLYQYSLLQVKIKNTFELKVLEIWGCKIILR